MGERKKLTKVKGNGNISHNCRKTCPSIWCNFDATHIYELQPLSCNLKNHHKEYMVKPLRAPKAWKDKNDPTNFLNTSLILSLKIYFKMSKPQQQSAWMYIRMYLDRCLRQPTRLSISNYNLLLPSFTGEETMV